MGEFQSSSGNREHREEKQFSIYNLCTIRNIDLWRNYYVESKQRRPP